MSSTFLFLLLVLLATSGCFGVPRNLALNGVATQSGIVANPYSGFADARNAIDGNRESTYEKGSCAHTSQQNRPWWRVDLLDSYVITSVIITNRGDAFSERLNGAELRIGNSQLENGAGNTFVQTIASIAAGESRTLTFAKGFEGRYVIITLPGNDRILTLCEVEVYGYPIPTGKNVAVAGQASQSSAYRQALHAQKAIDGITITDMAKESCTHTNNDFAPWWRLDLLQTHKVFSVAVTNRGDCCPERLNGAEIRIGNSLGNNGNNNPRCAVISAIPAGATQTFQCNGMDGRYVNVVIPGKVEFLSLCEVEVYGSPLE